MTTAERLRAEGRAETLLEILTLRFGPLPPAALAAVQAASLDQLKAWTAHALTAETLTDALR